MEAAKLGESVRKARIRIDPDFERAEAEKAKNEWHQKWSNRLGQAAQIATASGGIGGSIAGSSTARNAMMGFQMGGPMGAAIGAGVGVVQDFTDWVGKAADEAKHLAVAVVSFDSQKLGRGLVDLTERVPIAGKAIGWLGHTLFDLSDSINNTAKKLSQYSGPLAAQQAQLEVRRTLRDIDRANRFGPDLARAVESRDRMDRALEKISDKYLPQIVEAVASGLEIGQMLLKMAEIAMQQGQDAGQRFLAVLAQFVPGGQQVAELLPAIFQQILRIRRQTEELDDENMNYLDSMVRHYTSIRSSGAFSQELQGRQQVTNQRVGRPGAFGSF
jgi:hypothetical protein